MAAPTRTPRSKWIDAARDRLVSGGPDAIRIEAIAKDLGVTKGGFYGHFRDRDALIEEMLDAWEHASIDDAVALTEATGDDPRAKLWTAGALTLSAELLPVDLAVRDWARRDPDVAARLRRVDDGRMAYLRELFATFCDDPLEVEARSTLAFTLVVGHQFIRTDHGDHALEEVFERAGALLGVVVPREPAVERPTAG